MKIKSLLLVCALLLISKIGLSQTEHAAINSAWASLHKAYLLRNEVIIDLADTLRNRKAISNKAYKNLSRQVKSFNQTLTSPNPLNSKRTGSLARKNDKLTKTFGQLILSSGRQAPDHYYLEQLEAYENRLNLYKRAFNQTCTKNNRKDLSLPLDEAAPQIVR
ncbi:MAG: hypothetical protein JNM21_03890 [Taibaiella sp.]|nr:hypothetical protein [Taibaiella sp.]